MKTIYNPVLILLFLNYLCACSSAQGQDGGFQVLHYLYQVSGSKTISGIHNREPNAMPGVWTDKVHATTDKYPALWSGDFLFQQENIDNRQIMINRAISEWRRGSIVHLMWHACNPALQQPCGFDSTGVLSHLTDEQWNDLLTDGTVINRNWKSMMDEVCKYLRQLKNLHIEVIWRPLHEMNQGKFWWGGRPGKNGTIRLYELMHDYMTKTWGLNNLIWVWDLQDFSTLSADVAAYRPGNAYWQVAALDVYDQSGYSVGKYNTMKLAAAGKPMAIGECSRLPSTGELTEQPLWTFFMSWSELTFSHNTVREITALYSAPNVITLGEMPGWK